MLGHDEICYNARMARKLQIIEDHQFCLLGSLHHESRRVASCSEKSEALRLLAAAFEYRWQEHTFPDACWVMECCPPEDSPEEAWFASKFPDEGEYRFHIEASE